MKTNHFRFGKRTIEALTHDPKRRRYYYDTVCPGLELHANACGSKTFYFYRRIGNDPGRVKLGGYPAITPDQARDLAARYNGIVADGEDPRLPIRRARAELTLKEFFAIFMERHSRPRKRTCDEDQLSFDRYTGSLAGRKLSAIKRSDVEKLHSEMGSRAPYQANRFIALLHTVYKKAELWGYYEGPNPVKGIERFREISRERFLRPDEMPRFFKAVAKEPNTSVRDIVLLALLTGARATNVFSMRWEELRLEGPEPEWTIPMTKNGRPLPVPLVKEAVDLLVARQEQENNSPWVFPALRKGKKKNEHVTGIDAAWDRILARAGIKDLRLHDLRRSMGSWQARLGASLPIIGRSLGHRTASTTMIYARLSIDPVRRSMQDAVQAMYGASRESPAANVILLNADGQETKTA